MFRPDDERARMIGERAYEDGTSREIAKLAARPAHGALR